MTLKPTTDQIAVAIASLGMEAETDEVHVYRDLVEAVLSGHQALDELAEMDDEPQQIRYERGGWWFPDSSENPLGAWYARTRIEGAAGGKLAGRTVAIKDNVFVAGVPLMNGSAVLEGYIPPVDATIVTRILDAGGTIAGKSVCEAYCFSGGSHTSASGPVHNPHDHDRSAGGSSSGSAALVAAGEVDMAIGCDQGGSIRIPSAYCGTYGLKPTYGLVPYTGILGFDPTIDHVGPMTASVADNALLLEVIAGPDGLDSRQCSLQAEQVEQYTRSLGTSIEGSKIGVLIEGFGRDDSEADVDDKVRAAARRLERLGAEISEVSVPLHDAGVAIGFATFQSSIDVMFHTDGCLLGREDPVVLSYMSAQRNWRRRTADLPENIKIFMIVTEYLKLEHGYEYVAKGMNMVRRLRAAYDAVLERVDLLLMPTSTRKAPPLPSADAGPAEILGAAAAPLVNTMPFDNTHHPAMSVPCAMSEGLPVGMMLVGRHFEESSIYKVAHAFEQHEDWRSM